MILVIVMIAVSIGAASASDIQVKGNSSDEIQNAVDQAKSGDTIDLGSNKAYDISANQITISKDITVKGDNVNITANNKNGAFSVNSASGTKISGIRFINPEELPDYGGTISGTAINVKSSDNILISDCEFINYGSGIYLSTSRDSTVENCYFTGTTTAVKASETGTKAINIMGCNNLKIIGNTFDGQVLDGLSIASGSGNMLIENNTFINNTYAIFYGGASTQGSKIKNNRFITCGMLNTTWYSDYFKQTYNITYEDLPVISLQKASDNIEITGNEFIVKDNNRLIVSEAENTAHGYPSVIGAINITGNTVKKATPDVQGSSVKFYYINVLESLGINPVGDIVVKNNNFTDISDIESFKIDFASMTPVNGEITIRKALTSTVMSVEYVKDGKVVIALKDLNDRQITGEKIIYTLNGGSNIQATTDEYGHIYIEGLTGETKISARYGGNTLYTASSLTSTVDTKKSAPAVVKKATALTVAKKTFKKKATKKITATLKSGGKAVKGKKITFTVNKKTYTAKTNAKGVATVSVKLTKKGTYKYTAKFAGDSAYKAATKSNKIIVK